MNGLTKELWLANGDAQGVIPIKEILNVLKDCPSFASLATKLCPGLTTQSLLMAVCLIKVSTMVGVGELLLQQTNVTKDYN